MTLLRLSREEPQSLIPQPMPICQGISHSVLLCTLGVVGMLPRALDPPAPVRCLLVMYLAKVWENSQT